MKNQSWDWSLALGQQWEWMGRGKSKHQCRIVLVPLVRLVPFGEWLVDGLVDGALVELVEMVELVDFRLNLVTRPIGGSWVLAVSDASNAGASPILDFQWADLSNGQRLPLTP